MKKFPWGKVIERFEYDFDGKKVEIIKHHSNKFVNGNSVKGEFEDEPSYHIDELHASYRAIDEALIAWIVYQRLGINQQSLVAGICRALDIE